MERRDEPDLGIVDGGRLDLKTRTRRQAAEEIHNASAAHDGQRHAPGGGIAGSFDDRIRSALIVGESPYSGDNILHLVNVDGSDRAETFGHIERGGAPSQGDDPRSEEHTSELQSLTNLVCRPLLE